MLGSGPLFLPSYREDPSAETSPEKDQDVGMESIDSQEITETSTPVKQSNTVKEFHIQEFKAEKLTLGLDVSIVKKSLTMQVEKGCNYITINKVPMYDRKQVPLIQLDSKKCSLKDVDCKEDDDESGGQLRTEQEAKEMEEQLVQAKSELDTSIFTSKTLKRGLDNLEKHLEEKKQFMSASDVVKHISEYHHEILEEEKRRQRTEDLITSLKTQLEENLVKQRLLYNKMKIEIRLEADEACEAMLRMEYPLPEYKWEPHYMVYANIVDGGPSVHCRIDYMLRVEHSQEAWSETQVELMLSKIGNLQHESITKELTVDLKPRESDFKEIQTTELNQSTNEVTLLIRSRKIPEKAKKLSFEPGQTYDLCVRSQEAPVELYYCCTPSESLNLHRWLRGIYREHYPLLAGSTKVFFNNTLTSMERTDHTDHGELLCFAAGKETSAKVRRIITETHSEPGMFGSNYRSLYNQDYSVENYYQYRIQACVHQNVPRSICDKLKVRVDSKLPSKDCPKEKVIFKNANKTIYEHRKVVDPMRMAEFKVEYTYEYPLDMELVAERPTWLAGKLDRRRLEEN